MEVGQLRKTGEAHRKRVKLLEQELASQRIIAKVCSGQNIDLGLCRLSELCASC